ncbi:hypothetical protein AB0B30_32585 [Streptomyces narbonensis]|uniref:Uncharacterized protein n=1 Tax=Streptomyces narbonensis TaxID=67333 RepID=A0ABV3CIV9_9ACTN
MPLTDQQLAQLVTIVALAAGNDPEKTRQGLALHNLTDDDMKQALYYLESNRPILGR